MRNRILVILLCFSFSVPSVFGGVGDAERVIFDCSEMLSGLGIEVSNPRLAVWRTLPPQDNAVARIILIHGIKEYSRWHQNTIAGLSARGIEVVYFDLRGSGHSEGLPQFVHRFQQYVDDVRSVVRWTQNNLPPLPLYVLGHSLGGTIAIYYAASNQQQLSGLIVTAPAYLPGKGISGPKMFAARVLSTFFPRFRIWEGLARGLIAHDPIVEDLKDRDPLVYRFNTARQGDVALRAMSQLPQVVGRVHIPVFFSHGSADQLIQPAGTRHLYERVGSSDRTYFEVPGGFHELHNDTGRARLFEEIARWVRSH